MCLLFVCARPAAAPVRPILSWFTGRRGDRESQCHRQAEAGPSHARATLQAQEDGHVATHGAVCAICCTSRTRTSACATARATNARARSRVVDALARARARWRPARRSGADLWSHSIRLIRYAIFHIIGVFDLINSTSDVRSHAARACVGLITRLTLRVCVCVLFWGALAPQVP